MLLIDLLKRLKNDLLIDDELRAYIYEDGYIEIIEHMDKISLDKQTILDGSNISTLKIYFNKNIITCIEHNFSLFNNSNKQCIINILNLIGETIEDLDKYPKIQRFDKQTHVTLK